MLAGRCQPLTPRAARSGAGGVGCGERDGLAAGKFLDGLLSGERLRASCEVRAVAWAKIRLGGAQKGLQVRCGGCSGADQRGRWAAAGWWLALVAFKRMVPARWGAVRRGWLERAAEHGRESPAGADFRIDLTGLPRSWVSTGVRGMARRMGIREAPSGEDGDPARHSGQWRVCLMGCPVGRPVGS